MSTRIEGFAELAADLGQAPNEVTKKVRPIIRKGGVELRRRMQREMGRSAHFGHVARSIDFDEITTAGSIGVEVGPNADRSRSAPLAGIAYFGGANGGGGTVPEPDQALSDEGQVAAKFIADAMGGIL